MAALFVMAEAQEETRDSEQESAEINGLIFPIFHEPALQVPGLKPRPSQRNVQVA